MTAFLSRLAACYYSARTEDLLTTVALERAGLGVAIEESVAALNRCPRRIEVRDAEAQIERWIRGSNAVHDLFGSEAARFAADPSPIRIVATGARSILAAVARCRRLPDLLWVAKSTGRVIAALPPFLRVRRSAGIDRLSGADSQAHWSLEQDGAACRD